MNMVQLCCLSCCFTILVFVATLPRQLANAQATYTLKPTAKTVEWGCYDAKTPVLRVKSGDTVEIQTLNTSSPKHLEEAVHAMIPKNIFVLAPSR